MMNMTLFIFILLVQLIFTCITTTYYFRLMHFLSGHKLVYARLAELCLFVLFVLTMLPLCFFFPIWIAERMQIFNLTQESRAVLIAVGAFGLIVSCIVGWSLGKQRHGAKAISTRADR